jgi:Tfp pilus assembly protein PilF
VAARVAVAVVAVLVLGWLAVMERDARLQAQGAAALRPGATRAGLATAEDRLRRARLLNPDAQPDIYLALVRRARGDSAASLATVERVVRHEPDNLVAWGALAVLATRTDAAAVARARAASRRLDPVNARRASPARP